MTSLEMSLEEDALLRRLAVAEGIGIGETLRRGLELYAIQAGLLPGAANREVAAGS